MAKRIRNSQKVVNSTRIQMTCDQLVATCVGWPNGEKPVLNAPTAHLFTGRRADAKSLSGISFLTALISILLSTGTW